MTVVSTVNKQFGVVWPNEVLTMFEVLNALSFNIEVFSSLLCIFRITYYQTLVSSTLLLLLALLGIYLCLTLLLEPSWRSTCILFATYFVVFSYPVLSVTM
jgi:hypothetical protein